MQKQRKRPSVRPPSELAVAPLVVELRKSDGGATVFISGVVSIGELSERFISLATHSGRVGVHGDALSLTAFANKTVEVKGKIEGVDLGYAGN